MCYLKANRSESTTVATASHFCIRTQYVSLSLTNTLFRFCIFFFFFCLRVQTRTHRAKVKSKTNIKQKLRKPNNHKQTNKLKQYNGIIRHKYVNISEGNSTSCQN